MASLVGRLKRLVRPLVPARLLARRRPPSAPGSVPNLDVVISDPDVRQTWLRAAPSTVRVISPARYGDGPEVAVTVVGSEESAADGLPGMATRPLSAEESAQLAAPMADSSIGASVLGPADWDSTAGFQVKPLAVAVTDSAWSEVGGVPAGDVNLRGLLGRLIQAGHRLAVTPKVGIAVSEPRVDPIRAAGAVVVLAAVPLHDVGGGFRGAQIAMELCRRGMHVAYVAEYASGHSVDLGLRFVHPLLEEYRREEFDVAAYLERVETDTRVVLVELPSPPMWDVTRRLSHSGFRTVYDLIDDWSDKALGGWWYKSDVEDRFIASADTLAGSARALVRNLERRSGGRPVAYIPNGVNQNMFVGSSGEAPADVPQGDGPLLSYHGSLYGDWFDWDALRAVAEAFPDARVQVIGDEHGHPPVPVNVHFLGLKPQFQLPGYLAAADVSLVPFKLNETTHAVSPLKAYESLAMGVPVAAPPLEPLVGVEGAFLDEDLSAAVRAALAAPRLDADEARAAHGWAERVGRLFTVLGLPLPPPDGSDIVVKERPAVRYVPVDRSL